MNKKRLTVQTTVTLRLEVPESYIDKDVLELCNKMDYHFETDTQDTRVTDTNIIDFELIPD